MKINNVQQNQHPAFKANVRVVFDHDGRITELLPKLQSKIAKGQIPAYLGGYWTMDKNDNVQRMIQLGLDIDKFVGRDFTISAEKATPHKLAKAYFDLQVQLKKQMSKGAFKDFAKTATESVR